MRLEGISASALALALAAGFPFPAEAQEASGEEQMSAIDEIIVTARRREESLQDVPLAITALDAGDLDSVGARGLEDIAARTVGFTYEPFANSGNTGYPVIRGLSTSFVSARVQNVGVFMDGIYLQRQGMFDPGLMDVQRVEVVKGPQNALYGRNAFAGAINYVTGQPTDEPSGHLSADTGSGNRRSIKLQLAGPLGGDKVLAKIALGASDFDGHTRNDHPNAGLDLGGATTTDALGGWDDKAGSLALTYRPLEELSFTASYYHNETEREPAPYYVLWGANSGRVGFSQHGDLNCNQALRPGIFSGAPATVGNTLFCGELPSQPGPATAFMIQPAGSPVPVPSGAGPDNRPSGILVDPRSVGLDAETSIASFRAEWEINSDLVLSYLFGWTEYDAFTNGGNADRNPLVGSRITVPNKVYTADPDGPGPLTAGIDPMSGFTTFHVNQFSGRPITKLESTSHELRAEWFYGDFEVSGGLYYSRVDDEEHFQEFYTPLLGTSPTSQRAVYQGIYTPGDFVPVPLPPGTVLPPGVPAPTAPTSQNINPALFTTNADGLLVLNPASFRANPVQAELTRFDDEIAAAFASVSYDFLNVWRVALEARFTRESKEVQRVTPSLNQMGRTALNCMAAPTPPGPPGQPAPSPPGCDSPVGQVYNFSGAPLKDEENFTYITPRLTVEWRGLPQTLLYAYGASGVKAGGFNNAVRQDQLSYDEESNLTFELGAKSALMEGRLQLNAAVFYVDWEDMQVQETQLDQNGAPIAGANFVIGNLGSATNIGFEVEGTAALSDSLTMLFGFSALNPKFEDGTIYQEAIGTIGCSTQAGAPLPCVNPNAPVAQRVGSGDVSGKTLPRTSENQAYLGLLHRTNLSGGYTLTLGVDSTFQSKQWVSPLNLAHNGDRILVNASIAFGGLGQGVGRPGAWELTFWGRNILDEDYVGGVFHVAFLNQYLVAKGAGATWGANLRYDF